MPTIRKSVNLANQNRPYSIHDGNGVRVQRFASYNEAEKAATTWCQEKKAPVDIRRLRTRLATARPRAGQPPWIEMTWAGSSYA